MKTESRESRMVVIECGPDGNAAVWCDPEIVDLVTALDHKDSDHD